jgi:hypothetical protein
MCYSTILQNVAVAHMNTLLRPWLQLLVMLVGCTAQALQANRQPDKSWPAPHACRRPILLLSS